MTRQSRAELKLVTAPSGRYGIASAVALRAMADRSHGLQLAMLMDS
ncbi:MAG: hypothetical protein GXP52_09920 [Deltaproteobacteria bacterium]|nr:hypothetical protein [Deltaproteobacteria bacterium]